SQTHPQILTATAHQPQICTLRKFADAICGKSVRSSGERQLSFVPFQQRVAGRLSQIAKVDPNVASGRAGKICPPNLLVFLWEVLVDAIRVERLRAYPVNLAA